MRPSTNDLYVAKILRSTDDQENPLQQQHDRKYTSLHRSNFETNQRLDYYSRFSIHKRLRIHTRQIKAIGAPNEERQEVNKLQHGS